MTAAGAMRLGSCKLCLGGTHFKGAVADRHRIDVGSEQAEIRPAATGPAPGLGQPHSPSRKVGTIMLEHP